MNENVKRVVEASEIKQKTYFFFFFFFCKIRKLFIPSKVPEEINSVGSSCYSSPSQNYTTNRVLLMQIFEINLSFITEE